MQSKFEFSSKASTLSRLEGRLKNSEIPPFIYFTVSEWNKDRASVVKRIREKFDSAIVVRSSALNEDTSENSMAGYYTSVLGVDSKSEESITKAVGQVIESYGRHSQNQPDNQVLVQKQVTDVQLSGVAFTRDLETGAPYYIINYDDFSGRTDIITSGSSGQHKIFNYSKLYQNAPSDRFLAQVVNALRELEEATGSDALDVEFVVSKNTFHLLQARPIAASGAKASFSQSELKECLDNIKKFINENNQPFPNLAGKSTAYGVMPDWNPAEIIGIDPKPLAFSLYRYLITDTVWPLARETLGYRSVGYQPGICSLGGKPYVDVRMSFNTFTAAGISEPTAEKLIDFYIRKLRRFQDYHDKVEFKVVYTCYVLDWEANAEEMEREGFTDEEINEVRNAVFRLSDDILSERSISIDSDLGHAQVLGKKRERIRRLSIPLITKISQLGFDCKNFGTLPFSRLARFAFVGNILMKSLVRKGIITQEEYEQFYNSIKTVATEFLYRLGELKAGKITRAQFMSEYGHLRPGTYDICSRTYSEAFDDYVDLGHFIPPHRDGKAFEFGEAKIAAIGAELAAHGFSISAQQLLAFVRKATAARELSKLEFTKNLSLMLDYIQEFFSSHGIAREELAFLTIDDVLEFSHASFLHDSVPSLREKIARRKKEYAMMKLIKLPPLIFMDKSAEYFRSTEMAPNFITQKSVCADVVHLNSMVKGADLEGKIVLIENADPGYDWLFSHKIAGLVTEFGGAASHMTVRAAEFGLPSAIGCGPTLFNFVKSCTKIELNCGSKQIRAVL